jgi:hypothetical protein
MEMNMLSKLKMLVVLMLAGVVYASSTLAEPTFYKINSDKVRAGATLILRDRPVMRHSKRVGGITEGSDCIRNLGCHGGKTADQVANTKSARRASVPARWCQVEYQGKTGWIQGRFLAESTNPECEAGAPAAAPAKP